MKNLFILFYFLLFLSANAQIDCNSATITKVAREGSGNRVNWTMPISGEEVVISQGGDYVDYSTGGPDDFGVYHRFTPEDLVSFNGGILTQFVFAPTMTSWQTEFGHTFTIQIYKGGIWGTVGNRNPGTLISSQELNNNNLLPNEENTITLETPVTIDALQELWVGYFCTNIDSVQGSYSVGGDTGPRKDEFGNIMFYQNQWQTLFEINSSLNYNWCIKGIVQTIDGKSVNIYCNDTNIANNILGTTYYHSNPTGEENCYKVEVNCLEGGVSLLSNEVCIEGVGIKDNEQRGKFTVYPNPAKTELRVTSYELRVTNVEVFDIYGKNLHSSTSPLVHSSTTTIDISHLSAGVYFIRIIDEQGFSVQRFVKE